MKKLLAALLVLISSTASAQNYLRDDGIFHSVVEGTSNGQVLINNGGNLAGTTALPNGITATTQALSDNTTKIATDAFVQNQSVATNGNVTYVDSGIGVCTAKGDGVTDDAPAIRACAAQVGAQTLGGTVGFSCNKTYLLASIYPTITTQAILRPYSNVTWQGCGDSSVLKVANNMNTGSTQFAVIYPLDETATYTINNAQYRNFKIDFNGTNNNCSNTCYYQNVGIGTRYGDTAIIDNVTFANNPGSQNVSFGLNSSITFNKVVIQKSRAINGCDAVNSACTDHSGFYAVAQQVIMTDNICADTNPSAKATCIEMHGIALSAVGNSDYNMNKSFNIAAQIGHVANTVVVSGHTSYGASKGLQLFALNGLNFNNVTISGNVWRRSATNNNLTVAFIDFDQSVTSAGSTNISFTNNIIDGAAITAGTTDTTPVVLIGRSANTVVAGNTITGNSGECIATGTITSASSATIRDNILIDCGQTSVAGHQRGILAPASGTAASFNVMNNRVANVAAAYMTTGIDIALNVTAGYIAPNNRVEGVTTGVSLTGTGYYAYSVFGIAYSVGQGLPFTSTAALTDGQLLVGQTGAAALPKTISGSCTVAASGVLTCATMTATTGGLVPTPPNNTTTFLRGDGTFAAVVGADVALTNTHIFVGNASNIAADVAVSGDATMANTGALTLASTITAGGPTGSATVAPIITYDAKGRLTTVSSATITPAASSITNGAALTKTDDTNVTLTLGGSPSAALLAAASITVGWTGTLANARLATMVTNTVKGNATSGTANPTDLAVGSCSTAASALIWTTNTGFGCNTSITANAVPAANLTGSTLAAGVTASSLTSLGTIASLTATTINAFTLGGTISGGGNQINNVIIGTSTPLAGTFTTLFGTTTVNAGAAGTGSPTDVFVVNSGVVNKGVGIYDGTGAIRAFLRWNSGAGGYIGVFDASNGGSTQILGAGDSYIAAPAAGANVSFNTQTTGPSAQTGNTKWLTMNGAIQHAKNTVANLPTCNAAAEGSHYGVTDALAPTFLATLTGGGAVHATAYCNGTNWVGG